MSLSLQLEMEIQYEIKQCGQRQVNWASFSSEFEYYYVVFLRIKHNAVNSVREILFEVSDCVESGQSRRGKAMIRKLDPSLVLSTPYLSSTYCARLGLVSLRSVAQCTAHMYSFQPCVEAKLLGVPPCEQDSPTGPVVLILALFCWLSSRILS